jgi:hypothetical protein
MPRVVAGPEVPTEICWTERRGLCHAVRCSWWMCSKCVKGEKPCAKHKDEPETNVACLCGREFSKVKIRRFKRVNMPMMQGHTTCKQCRLVLKKDGMRRLEGD